jgi:catechol 2,3-dioxygenase-like lactoylglutathione lyase family enzyme
MKRGLLSHVEIYVSDLEASSAFWGWFLTGLGYHLHQSWAEGRSWKMEDTYFVIVQVEEKYKSAAYHRKQVGLNHLAFHAESAEDVDRMTEALKEKGVTLLYTDRHPQAGGNKTHAVYFEDPDRIKVEFVAKISGQND